jgi:hypothetical protein
MTKHKLAEWLHDNYEELAKANDWQTQEITRVRFDDLPEKNKATMLALADRMINTFNFITYNTVLAVSLPLSESLKFIRWLNDDNWHSFYKGDELYFYHDYKEGDFTANYVYEKYQTERGNDR